MEYRLLDTDVFSSLMEPGDARGLPYLRHVAGKTTAVTLITAGELIFGATRRSWGEKRMADLHKRVSNTFILPFDLDVAKVYDDLKSQLSASGRRLDDNDIWIAASAVRYSVPLISNNRKHFERVPGLVLISEAP